MSRRLKELVVNELTEQFKGMKSCVLVEYRGLNARQMDDLRRSFARNQVRLQVIKNSLAAIALERVGLGELKSYLQGPTAIVRGGDDPAALAKLVVECAKKYEGIKIRGGYSEGRTYDPVQVKALSAIPPREVLYARMLGFIQGPMAALAGAFSSIQRSLACALRAIMEKKEKESPPPAPESTAKPAESQQAAAQPEQPQEPSKAS